MEKEETKLKEKPNNGVLKLIIVVLLIIVAGLVGWILGSGKFDIFKGNEPTPNPNQKEELVEGYKFRLKNITCEKGEYTCTKSLKVAYDGKNHDITIKNYQKIEDSPYDNPGNKTNDLYYEIYVDNNQIDKELTGYLYLDPETMDYDKDYNMDFDGYVYIFDGKYLGFLLTSTSPTGSSGYSLRLYNDGKQIGEAIVIDSAGQSMDYNGSRLDDIDNTTFDGNTLEYWFVSCEESEKYIPKNDEGPNAIAVKQSLTFNGTKANIKVLDEKREVTVGGQGC